MEHGIRQDTHEDVITRIKGKDTLPCNASMAVAA